MDNILLLFCTPVIFVVSLGHVFRIAYMDVGKGRVQDAEALFADYLRFFLAPLCLTLLEGRTLPAFSITISCISVYRSEVNFMCIHKHLYGDY